jgi:hypothetical protein
MDCGDGVTDVFDALEIIDIVLGLVIPSGCQLTRGDVPNGLPPNCGNPPGTPNCDSDGDIDIFDFLVVTDRLFDKTNCVEHCLCGIDSDSDGIVDAGDNCRLIPNGPALGVCCNLYCSGETCMSNDDCPDGWSCNMDQGNVIQCDCKASFDCDVDVDGTDAALFKIDFGRGQYSNPCTNEDSCNGDFDCDVDLDGTDAVEFKRVFGRTPLPPYNVCISCVDDVYIYGCSY